jgi:triosephosphate isomerase
MGRTNSRVPLVAGNWKMNLDHVEAIHLLQSLALRLRGADTSKVEVSVHPPFTDLRSVEGIIGADELPITLGAQHCSHLEAGAYTGEVSVGMLRRLSVKMVLVGHSERREFYGMTDELVAQTAAAVLSGGLTAVICVGETAEQRDAGETSAVLSAQVTAALAGVAKGSESSVLFAYEPIWAIGTGVAATEEDAQVACAHIRSVVAEDRSGEVAASLRILYGGSAKPENAGDLVSQPDVDGLLVGGASLVAESFGAMIDAVAACYGSPAGNGR